MHFRHAFIFAGVLLGLLGLFTLSETASTPTTFSVLDTSGIVPTPALAIGVLVFLAALATLSTLIFHNQKV